eukprot:scaffold455_cov160-Pinguiococcus_pyrenoidosus.AAC.8
MPGCKFKCRAHFTLKLDSLTETQRHPGCCCGNLLDSDPSLASPPQTSECLPTPSQIVELQPQASMHLPRRVSKFKKRTPSCRRSRVELLPPFSQLWTNQDPSRSSILHFSSFTQSFSGIMEQDNVCGVALERNPTFKIAEVLQKPLPVHPHWLLVCRWLGTNFQIATNFQISMRSIPRQSFPWMRGGLRHKLLQAPPT